MAAAPSKLDRALAARPRLRALVWRGLCALAAVWILAGVLDVWYEVHDDLPSFWVGARLAFVEGEAPYDAPEFYAARSAELGQHIYPFLHPPPSVLSFLPLAWLDWPQAAALALIGNGVFALLLVILLVRLLPGSDAGSRAVPIWLPIALGVYALWYFPLWVTVDHGQVNIVVTVCIVGAWLALHRRAHAAAIGLPIGLAIVLKVYPALLLGVLALRGRWRAVGWALGLVGAFTLVSLVALPDGSWPQWIGQVLPTGGYAQRPFGLFSPVAPWNQSLNAFASRMLLPNTFGEVLHPSAGAARLVGYGLAGGVLALTAGVVVRAARRGAKTLDLELAVVLCAAFMVAPLSWEHHLVFLLPVATVFIRRAALDDAYGRWAALGGLCALGVLGAELPLADLMLRDWPVVLLQSVKLYGVVVVWAVLLRDLYVTASAGHDARRMG